MKIIKLEAENIKRLKAIRIEPDGSTVVIGGKNAQGKSSVLDCIVMALGGKRSAPPRPVRDGQEEGVIDCQLDELRVIRKFKASGETSLVVEAKDGAKYSSPQAILDAMVGSLSLDPLEFTRMDPKAQLVMLQEMVGLDFTAMNKTRSDVFAERAAVNRTVKALEGQMAGLPEHQDTPDTEVSVVELTDQLEAARALRDVAEAAQRALEAAKAQADDFLHQSEMVDVQVENLKREQSARANRVSLQIEQLKIQLAEDDEATGVKVESLKQEQNQYRGFHATAKSGIAGLENDAKDAAATVPDGHAIKGKIANAESTNQKVRENARKAEVYKELQGSAKVSLDLTGKLEILDAQKVKETAEAEFPIDGLELGDGGVLFNGIPFEQASSAEQLRVSVAIGLAMNPKLSVLLVHDGSLLDAANLKLLTELATEAGAQVWIERVSTGDECSLIIEDGEVKA